MEQEGKGKRNCRVRSRQFNYSLGLPLYFWPTEHKRPLCLTGVAIKVVEDRNNADLLYLS